MRPFEAWLWLADLLTFVVTSAPRLRMTPWPRCTAVIAAAIAVAQVQGEGPRWQMFPAYALTGTFLLVSLLRSAAPASRSADLGRSHRTRFGLGVLGLAVSLGLPMLIPVFRFPQPTGVHKIGTVTYDWVDAALSDAFNADPLVRRELMVQVWYPSQESEKDRRAAYLPDADAVTAAFARIQNVPAFIFSHFKYVTSNATASSPASVDQANYPVLLFLEGATGFRQMNTFQVEELVSHGYIVVAMDQPGTAADVVFPDGHQVGWSLDAMALIRQSYMPTDVAPVLNGRAYPDSIVRYLANDVVFTLDQLAVLNRADPNGILTGKLDLKHVGVFGVSLGGIVAGEACRIEPRRVGACLMMDAPMATDVVTAGLRQPCMWITRDVVSMRLERQRAGGWSEAEIVAHRTSMRTTYSRLAAPGYFVQVPGMFHSNFTDVPNWTPLAFALGFSGPIGAQRARDIVNAYSVAFFDQHLKGQPAKLLDGPPAQYPQVLFESRRP